MNSSSRPAASWLPDLIAGLAVVGLLIPEAVAYSSIAAVLTAATLSLAGGDASLRLALAAGLTLLTGSSS